MIREYVMGSYFIIFIEMLGTLNYLNSHTSFSDRNNILRNVLFAMLPLHDNYRIDIHI